jgi:hypothetical protein
MVGMSYLLPIVGGQRKEAHLRLWSPAIVWIHWKKNAWQPPSKRLVLIGLVAKRTLQEWASTLCVEIFATPIILYIATIQQRLTCKQWPESNQQLFCSLEDVNIQIISCVPNNLDIPFMCFGFLWFSTFHFLQFPRFFLIPAFYIPMFETRTVLDMLCHFKFMLLPSWTPFFLKK